VNTSLPAVVRNVALLSIFSATASADPAVMLYHDTDPAMVASLEACAHATAKDSGPAHIDVVRYVEHAGRGNYEYWLNAVAPMKERTYCRTQHDAIAEFRSFDGNWIGTRPARPHGDAQVASSTATCSQSCRADQVVPPGAGSNLGDRPRP
jgi:hypothetical protein